VDQREALTQGRPSPDVQWIEVGAHFRGGNRRLALVIGRQGIRESNLKTRIAGRSGNRELRIGD
jgi:hypothetical protein